MTPPVNIRILLLTPLMYTSVLFSMQQFNDFFNENKEYCIGAFAFTTIAGLASYHYYKKVTDPIYKYKSMIRESISNYKVLRPYINTVNGAKKFKDKKAFEELLPQIKMFIDNNTPPDILLHELLDEQNSLTPEEQEQFEHNPINYNNFKRAENKNFYIKSSNSFFRTVCSHRMQKIINDQGYLTIGVPKKYLLLSLNKKRWLNIAEKIPYNLNNSPHTIDLTQMKELVDFVDCIGFSDFRDNLGLDNNGKIFFLDTELRSFSLYTNSRESNVELLQGFLQKHSHMTLQAAQYLEKTIEKLKKEPERKNYSIPYQTNLDNDNINKKDLHLFFKIYHTSKQNDNEISFDGYENNEWIV